MKWGQRQLLRRRLVNVYGSLPRNWMLNNARPEFVERIMLYEYQQLRRGKRHTSIFSKDSRGKRRRQARRFVLALKYQELSC